MDIPHTGSKKNKELLIKALESLAEQKVIMYNVDDSAGEDDVYFVATILRKAEKDIIKAYWHNIIYILKNICPAIEGWKKQIEYMCLDNMLKIKIPKDIFYEKLKKNNIEEVIRNILLEELGIDYEVKVEKAIGEKIDKKKLIEKTDKEIEDLIKELDFDVKEEHDEEEGYVIKDEYDEHMIYGEDVNSLVHPIKDLNQNSKTVAIVGEIFHIKNKELRNGKILSIMSITDNTSSINCKLFLNDLNKDKILNAVKEGSYVKIKGDVLFDTYQRELTMTISGIRAEVKPQREDTCKKGKRVELHAHTQMSSMDALCSTKKLVKQADSVNQLCTYEATIGYPSANYRPWSGTSIPRSYGCR